MKSNIKSGVKQKQNPACLCCLAFQSYFVKKEERQEKSDYTSTHEKHSIQIQSDWRSEPLHPKPITTSEQQNKDWRVEAASEGRTALSPPQPALLLWTSLRGTRERGSEQVLDEGRKMAYISRSIKNSSVNTSFFPSAFSHSDVFIRSSQ